MGLSDINHAVAEMGGILLQRRITRKPLFALVRSWACAESSIIKIPCQLKLLLPETMVH